MRHTTEITSVDLWRSGVQLTLILEKLVVKSWQSPPRDHVLCQLHLNWTESLLATQYMIYNSILNEFDDLGH